jgi:hypothetical protein
LSDDGEAGEQREVLGKSYQESSEDDGRRRAAADEGCE